MNILQEIFRSYGDTYMDQYGDRMPARHRKVIRSVQDCGTSAFGVHAFVCDDCHDVHRTGSSCGNRHCPVCQAGKSDEWLQKQMNRLLPVNYFMVTFTVPEPLRRTFRTHPEAGYAALFKAASYAMKKLSRDPRFVGCRTAGFTGILHTWTRQLEYHPHVHFIVPGGGLDDAEWKSSGAAFFVPARPLSKIYRAKLVDLLTAEGIDLPECVWETDWVVDSRHVGSGKRALEYLSQYVFRVAISPNRIVRVEDDQVTFRYRRSGEKKQRLCTLHVFEFMRRYLQHVLPYGFTKIRHYGFMSPNSKVPLRKIRELICRLYEIITDLLPQKEPEPKKPWICKHCGGHIHWHHFTPPRLSSA